MLFVCAALDMLPGFKQKGHCLVSGYRGGRICLGFLPLISKWKLPT